MFLAHDTVTRYNLANSIFFSGPVCLQIFRLLRVEGNSKFYLDLECNIFELSILSGPDLSNHKVKAIQTGSHSNFSQVVYKCSIMARHRCDIWPWPCLSSNINFCVKIDYKSWGWISITASPGGLVGNTLLTWVQSLVGGIHSDSDDHYNGGPVSLDPQWHVKEPWRRW